MTVGNQPPPIGRPDGPMGIRPAPARPADAGPGPARNDPSAPVAGRQPGAPHPPGPGRGRRALLAALVAVVLLAGVGFATYRQASGDTATGGRELSAAEYTVTVPQEWTPAPPGAGPVPVFGVPFGLVAQAADYPCRDGSFTRAAVRTAQVAVPAGVPLEQAATAFARGAGEAIYAGAAPQVAVGVPAPRGAGSRVEATVRTDGQGGCRATEATVLVLAEPRVTAADGSTGAALLVVSGDTRGGPPEPAPGNRDDLVAVLDSAAPATS